MRFGSGENDYSVGFCCDGIEVCDRSGVGRAERVRLHSRANGRACRFFFNAEPVEYFGLTLFSGAAVTAHSGKHERLATTRFNRVNDAGEQLDKTAHTATAGSYADPRTLLEIV
jgi:hypothetical protein